MINILLGDNSIGKTKFLLKMAAEESNNCVSNLNMELDNSVIPMSYQKYTELKNIIGTTQDGIIGNKIAYINYISNNQQVICSDSLRDIFSLLCKDRKLILLDDLEIDLSLDELLLLLYVFEARDPVLDDVWVVTHSEYLVGHQMFKYFTIVDNKLTQLTVEESDEWFD